MMLNPGDSFGDYKVIRLLGQGGMGSVFLLENAEGGWIAAKILDPESAGDEESRKRFLREAQLALGVQHPNLVETYDVGEDPDTGLCYILMEYVPGGSLADKLKGGPLAVNEAISIVYQIASVLELARQRGIVHRDIKPDNIMFGADGKAKLADLGIARGGVGGVGVTTVTQTGMMIGTPAYMSPEQMMDAHNVDCRADIYSLGIVFYEMLTGVRPNKDDTVVQLMAKAVAGEPIPDVRKMRPEVSAALAELISLMCAMKTDERVQTPVEVTTALSQIVHGREVTIVRKRPSAMLKKSVPHGDSSRKIVAAVFALLAAGGVAAFLYFRPEHRVPPPKPDRAVAPQQEIAALPREVNVVREMTNVEKRVVVVTNVVERQVARSTEMTASAPEPRGERPQSNGKDWRSLRRMPSERAETLSAQCGGYTWYYKLNDLGHAVLWRRNKGRNDDPREGCVEPLPVGAVEVPRELDGYPVTGIGIFAFAKCSQMTEIRFPEGLVFMSSWVFYRCENLTAVRFPKSLKSVGCQAFAGCMNLRMLDLNMLEEMFAGPIFPPTQVEIKVSPDNPVYTLEDGVLYARNKTVLVRYPSERTELVLPKTVTEIFDGAFRSSRIRSLRMLGSIESVGGVVFEGSEVKEIRFGQNLRKLKSFAFSGSSVSRLIFEGDAPELLRDVHHPDHRTLFVPTDWKLPVQRNRADLTVYVHKGSKGWKAPDQTGLPELWPVGGDPAGSRRIRYIEDGIPKDRIDAAEDGSGQPVARVPALPSKTFNLPRKVELQMIGCPAGTFRMGYPNAPAGYRVAEVHEVRFTRPFWIARHPVTKEQWVPLMGKVQLSNVDRALGGMKAPITGISGEKIREYCRNLTRRLKSGLPKGYVFRLPTDAEWEYALRGGSEDWADPYVGGEGRDAVAVNEMDKKIRLRKAGLAHLIKEKVLTVGPCEVCTKKPNGWGVYDMLGNVDEWVLDTFPVENPDGSYKKSAADVMGEVTYRAQETDPLRWSGDDDVIGMIRCNFNGGHPGLRKFISPKSQFAPIGFRVVLGPDLEKEQRDAARATKRKR